MSFRFQFRRGTTAERDASNPILAAGEPAVVLDSGQPAELVLGDGVTAMADLRAAVWDDDTRLALAGTATQPGDLGTAAAADVGDFGTAAQGAKADTAVQPAALDAIPALAAVGASLDSGQTFGIQVLSDSSGNDPTDWPGLLANSIATAYPAFTVHTRTWSDATQEYAAPTVVQTGTAGTQHLAATLALNGLTAPGAHPTSGDLDVRVDLELPAWSGTAVTPVARSGGTGTHSWWINVTATGALSFVHSPDGTGALLTDTSTATLGFTANARRWVRAHFRANNGSGSREVKFYHSTNGIAWTQLGTTVTAAASTIYNPGPTAGAVGGRIEFGGRGTVALSYKLYEVQIRDGAGGPTIAPCLPGLWQAHPLATADSAVAGAPVLTIVNGSHPGATVAYHADPTRMPRLTPNYGQRAALVALSHNEGHARGVEFLTYFRAYLSTVTARLQVAPVVLTQNPQEPGVVSEAHAARRADLLGIPEPVIDTFGAFLAAGWPGALMADSVHPNAAGSAVSRDAVLAAMGFDS